MELTLKSVGDYRVPLRFDGVKAKVVGITPFSVKVVVPGQKTIRSINPIEDTYEQMPLDEVREQLKVSN